MTNDLARWQFATTSIYHFLFVPVTIGLAFLVALLQTAWYRNAAGPSTSASTRFFGTLLLINVAIGVVTGLVQEFEFGMNWSAYSRFVGDVFGGPLAMEGLAAFFLESTFLGLWIFGWDRLPKRVHLACIWLVAAGSMLSALFILAANSWMQHPVGYVLNSHGQPVLNNVWALFTNPTFLWGYVHVILASLVTGSLVMLAISAWYLRKHHEAQAFHHDRAAVGAGAAAGDPAADVRRQQARRDRGEIPAGEDRGGRGAVEQLPAVLVLGVSDRRRQQRPDPDPAHRDPAPALDPRDRDLERRGGRAEPAAAGSTSRNTGPATTSPTCSSSTGRCA